MGDQQVPNVCEGPGAYTSRNSLSSGTATENLDSHSQLMSCTCFVESVPGGQLPARGAAGRKSEAATPSLMCAHSEDSGQRKADSGQTASVATHQLGSALLPQRRMRPAPLQDTGSESHVEWTDSTADKSQGALGQVLRTHSCQHQRSNR